MIKLKDIATSKVAGKYDYKLNDTYYQLYDYFGRYWVVYETKETECDTPCDWLVIDTCSTLKDAKKVLSNYINKGNYYIKLLIFILLILF